MKKITNLMIHTLKINKNCNKKMDDKSKRGFAQNTCKKKL